MTDRELEVLADGVEDACGVIASALMACSEANRPRLAGLLAVLVKTQMAEIALQGRGLITADGEIIH